MIAPACELDDYEYTLLYKLRRFRPGPLEEDGRREEAGDGMEYREGVLPSWLMVKYVMSCGLIGRE